MEDIVKAKRAFLDPAPKCINCGTRCEIHDDGLEAFWWCPQCKVVPSCGYYD